MPKLKILSIAAVFIILLGYVFVSAAELPKWFPFKKKDSLNEWEEKIFKGRVLYSVKATKTDGYLSAISKNAASGIFYRIRFNPKKTPLVSWKWKVVKFPEASKVKLVVDSEWIEKDDYAARFYVIFPKLAFNLTKTLEYVWDKQVPKGTILTSPYYKNIKIIVLESGREHINRWVLEKRNIYDDFKQAFGLEPGEAGAIAIMTDTDDTASTAEAYYDEIRVGYKNGTE
ncbi:MAG: DUF3047 domain-containing protein [Candidatus Omnitrophica bacterium]|nr:DUF3047 domain-containing protein [Candidatus Omnitrophota bacterium]